VHDSDTTFTLKVTRPLYSARPLRIKVAAASARRHATPGAPTGWEGAFRADSPGACYYL